MDQVLTWFLNNPKLFTVAAGLILAVIEAWRQRSKGKAARNALDLVNNQLREMGFTRPSVMQVAADVLQARSRRKALLELRKSDIRLSTDDTAAWVRNQARMLKEKKG